MSDPDTLIKKLSNEGVPENTGGSNYEDSLIEIDEVEFDKTGRGAKYKFLRNWESGKVVILIHCKILDGQFVGGRFRVVQVLFRADGQLNAYPSFISKEGKKVPASALYEIIKKIKEYDEAQWDSGVFTDDKLIGCKFMIGVRRVETADKPLFFAAFERQLQKDEKYEAEKAQQKLSPEFDEIESKPQKTEKKTKKEVIEDDLFDADDLPF